jgi:hypothetical protein
VVTPKVGFENGIILKAHCRSAEEDEHWANVHSSEERERTLITEALGETEDAEAMLRVASHNRLIRGRNYHFFKQAELLNLIRLLGFKIVFKDFTYGNQALFFVATKE